MLGGRLKPSQKQKIHNNKYLVLRINLILCSITIECWWSLREKGQVSPTPISLNLTAYEMHLSPI